MASSWQSSCFMDQKRFGKTGSSVIAWWYSDVHSQNRILSAFQLLPRCFWILKTALGKDLDGFLTFLDVPGLHAQCEHELLSFCWLLCLFKLSGAKCTQSVFSGILWLHPCWRLRTPDQSMAIVWTTWESDAWQAFANYIKNFQESNYILNHLHVYEIYATTAVFADHGIAEDARVQDDRQLPKHTDNFSKS